ncbi:hypothetical protein niasHS_002360 [Heterodera schachtii]|uniref:Uncharacterized protein n=1 Tax=Heterodera schachtii TaxID=97005 RepID=A0ABD2KK89_HETSC
MGGGTGRKSDGEESKGRGTARRRSDGTAEGTELGKKKERWKRKDGEEVKMSKFESGRGNYGFVIGLGRGSESIFRRENENAVEEDNGWMVGWFRLAFLSLASPS